MRKKELDALQMFLLLLHFEFGTALVVNPAKNAGRDSWIAMIIGAVGGMILVLCYSSLHRKFPDLNLTGYSKQLLGKILGTVVGIFYLLFFLYDTTRDLRDGISLIQIRALNTTPLLVIGLLLVVVSTYVLYLGIHVLGRIAILYGALSIFLILTMLLLLSFSGVIDLHNLLPIASKGWQPILGVGGTSALMFPFGELVSFTMVLPTMSKKYNSVAVCLTAVLFGGTMLTEVTVLMVASLGSELFVQATHPFLTMINRIEVSDFIDRVDVLGVMAVIIGIFFKVTVLLYAALRVAEDLFGIPYRRLLFPFGIIVLLSSLLIAPNLEEHLQESDFILVHVYPLFVIVIPFLLLAVAWMQGGRRKRSPESDD
ncbi:Spore germination protein YndE [compost metagenome]